MSGSNVTFLFPDHTTAMTGTFSKSEMLLGQVCFLQVGIQISNKLVAFKRVHGSIAFYTERVIS